MLVNVDANAARVASALPFGWFFWFFVVKKGIFRKLRWCFCHCFENDKYIRLSILLERCMNCVSWCKLGGCIASDVYHCYSGIGMFDDLDGS